VAPSTVGISQLATGFSGEADSGTANTSCAGASVVPTGRAGS
jgi:hypothetical protein